MDHYFDEIAPSLLPIWEMSIPDIPRRSRLYSLPPLGLNSSLVESLTSYIGRLAYEHHLEVGTLIQYTIAPILGKRYIAEDKSRSVSSFLRFAGPMNGNSIMASDWVGALESLTLRADLAFLTLLVGANALSQRDLLQPVRQWCPLCYEGWRSQGATVYEPLLWSINGITICPEHCQPLERCCPRCSSPLPWLAWRSRPGYCSSCGRWLGRASGHSQVEEKERFTAETVGAFLAQLPQLPLSVPREGVIRSLRDLIAATTGGNIAAFSRSLGLPRTTLWELVQGYFPPSLPFLLQLCYQFRLSLLQFLSGIKREDIAPAAAPLSQEQIRKRDLRRPLDREKVQKALEDILADRQCMPLSTREVARRLGYPVRTIKEYFPMQCREIARRYAEYRKQQGQRRITDLRLRIHEAACDVHGQMLTPTYRRVGTVLNTPGCFREREARRALLASCSRLEGDVADGHASAMEQEYRQG
jgi:TniQ